MNKIKLLLLTFCTLCTLSGYAQEEFFGHNTGLSASYSKDFNFAGIENSNEIGDGQLSLHLKSGLILSGDYFKISNSDFYGATIGYLINNKYKDKLKGLLGFSYGELTDQYNINNKYKITAISFGLMKVLFTNSNFPSSISASTSASFFLYGQSDSYLQSTVTVGYSQSFFANNQIYPVIGIGKTFLLFKNDVSNENFTFHIGLNVRLSQSDAIR